MMYEMIETTGVLKKHFKESPGYGDETKNDTE